MRVEQRADMVDDGLIDFSQYAGVIGRRKWLVLAITLLGVLGGGVSAHLQPKSYTSTAQVSVNAVSSNVAGQSLDSSQVNMATQVQIATSTVVAALARTQLKSTHSAQQLPSGLRVTAPSRASTLLFAYTATTPRGAQSAAQAFADAYLAQRRAQAKLIVGRVMQAVKDDLAAIDAKLAQTQLTLVTATRGTAPYESALALQTSLNQQAAPLRTRLIDLATLVIDPGSVIAPAALPTQPVGLPKSVYLAAGAVLGLVFGLLLAFLWDRRDDRLDRAADVESHLGLPLVAAIPGRRRTPLTLIGSAVPEQLEAYGALAARVEVVGRAGCRVIVVTSPREDRVGAATGVNLAVALARSGRRVSLVAADRKETTVQQLLATEAPAGVEQGKRQLPQSLPGVRMVPADKLGTAGTFLNPDHVRSLFEDLKAQHDYVVVVAPPVLVASDTLVLCSAADGALLAATRGVTRRGDIAAAERELRRVGARLIGVAVQGDHVPRSLRRHVQRRYDSAPVMSAPEGQAKAIPAMGTDARNL